MVGFPGQKKVFLVENDILISVFQIVFFIHRKFKKERKVIGEKGILRKNRCLRQFFEACISVKFTVKYVRNLQKIYVTTAENTL